LHKSHADGSSFGEEHRVDDLKYIIGDLHRAGSLKCWILSAFAELRKVTNELVKSLSFCPSVCPHGTTQFALDGFHEISWNNCYHWTVFIKFHGRTQFPLDGFYEISWNNSVPTGWFS
jgi:hypothetical protein